MPALKHLLITGPQAVGKSTLVQRLLAYNAQPVCGFYTKQMQTASDGLSATYLCSARAEDRFRTEYGLAGISDGKGLRITYPKTYDNLVLRTIQMPGDGLLVMDQLDETTDGALLFQQAVLDRLDGTHPVIVVIPELGGGFLDAVRSHPKVSAYPVTLTNRDQLLRDLVPRMLLWNRGIRRVAL